MAFSYLTLYEALQFSIFIKETEVTGFSDAVRAISHRTFTTADCYKALITQVP